MSTTVRAELELPLEIRGEPSAARARAVEEVSLALAMPHLLERPVDTLSGGELQRVALAAALVGRPQLVLLDEPTSQLDPVAGDELVGLLRRLNEEWGMAIVLAEHRLERCLGAADRAAGDGRRAHRVRRQPAGSPALGARARSGARDPGRAVVRAGRARRAAGRGQGRAPRPARPGYRAARGWVRLTRLGTAPGRRAARPRSSAERVGRAG